MTDSLRTRKERALSREATDRPASRPRGSSSATLQKFRPSFKGKGMSLDRVAMHRKAGAVGGGGSDDGGYEMEGIDSDDGGGEAATPLAATTKQDSARGADMFAILGGQDSLESVTVMAGGFGMEEGPFLTGGGASNAAGGGGAGGVAAGGVAYGAAGGSLLKPPMRAELLVQVASLVDLRLFSRASRDAQIDAMRLRCEAPKEVVRGVASAVNFDLRQYEEE